MRDPQNPTLRSLEVIYISNLTPQQTNEKKRIRVSGVWTTSKNIKVFVLEAPRKAASNAKIDTFVEWDTFMQEKLSRRHIACE